MLQINAAQGNADLRTVCLQEEYSNLILETGMRKPLSSLTLVDKDELCKTLCHYYIFLRGQCELDQFVEGLTTYGVLDMMRKCPRLMEPLFVASQESQLSKGILVYILHSFLWKSQYTLWAFTCNHRCPQEHAGAYIY